MSGLFTQLAGMSNAREQGMRDATLQAEQDDANKLRKSALLQALAASGNISARERPMLPRDTTGTPTVGLKNPDGTTTSFAVPKLRDPSQVDTPDPTQSTELGNTGRYQLTSKTPAYLAKVAEQNRQTTLSQRRAAVRSKYPEYKGQSDDALNGIVEDDQTYRDLVKPVTKTLKPLPDGTTGLYDENTGRIVPTGMAPKLHGPIPGTPEDLDYQGKKAEILARVRAKYSGGSGNAAITEDDKARVALQGQLGGVQKQMADSRQQLTDELATDDYDKPSGIARRGTLTRQLDSLRKVSSGVNGQIGAIAGHRAAGALKGAGLTPQVTETDPDVQSARAAAADIKSGAGTMAQAMASAMTPGAKAALRRLVGQ